MTNVFLPEGSYLQTPENAARCGSVDALLRAIANREVVEGVALTCGPEHDLTVRIGPFTGVIPRQEAALGIASGATRDIAILSRAQAQALALAHMLSTLTPGQIIPALVTHLEPFGAFVDIGCGVPSMIGIENISVSRLRHPKERFQVGQSILAVVTGVDKDKGRVLLSHKELLGTWEENAALFTTGMTVPGWVRSVKDYGLFVELTPNLSGLAEPRPDYAEGERVSVYIKSMSPQQMKIKLLLIDHLPPEPQPPALDYFLTKGRLTRWRYAPEGCQKPAGETIFL